MASANKRRRMQVKDEEETERGSNEEETEEREMEEGEMEEDKLEEDEMEEVEEDKEEKWFTHFIKETRGRGWGNSPKSRILFVTRDKNEDNRLVKKCRADSRTNHMTTLLTEWVNYPHLKEEIDSLYPTIVVTTFDDDESEDIYHDLRCNFGVNRDDGSYKCSILHLKNIFNPEQCILLSTTKTDGYAVEQQLRDAGLVNDAPTRV